MRASLLVPCALAVAVAGCKGPGHKAAPPSQETNVAPAAAEGSAPEGLPDEIADSPESFFVPEGDGRVAAIVRKDAPNMRYAQLGRDACLAELGRRAIAFEEAPPTEWARTRSTSVAQVAKVAKPVKKTKATGKPAPPGTKPAKTTKSAKLTSKTKGKTNTTAKSKPKTTAAVAADLTPAAEPAEGLSLLAPVRLRGPLQGITIHSALPEKVREKSTIEIFDCRLVLALDDFASVLAKHDIVEVIHMSAFRSQRDRGCTPKYTGKQHCAALAVDIGTFKKKDGSVLDVDKDFNGKIGTPTCTAGTGPNPVTPAATELWDIVCESARRGLFHVMLTPNFNVEHKNHFHVEITPDVAWMLIK